MGVQMTADLDALRDHLARIAAVPPTTTGELVAALESLAKLSNQWSEVIESLQDPTRRLVGPAAAASVTVAARRAEESFVELEITLGDALAAHPRVSDTRSRQAAG
jgi:hypothetical protein